MGEGGLLVLPVLDVFPVSVPILLVRLLRRECAVISRTFSLRADIIKEGTRT